MCRILNLNCVIVPRKKIKNITDAGFIPGIYNYCDRWCEKCELCLRCMSFVMGKKLEEKGGFNIDKEIVQGEEGVWPRLKSVFESTYEVLHEVAEERGIEVEDIYASENIDREFWGEDFEGNAKSEKYIAFIESSDIIRICMIYEDLADKCLEKIFEFFDEQQQDKTAEKAADEALDVINWYLDLIQAKMRRALYGYYQSEEKGKQDDDYNGSAKVALIAADRSLEKWKVLYSRCVVFKKEISHLIVILEQLRIDIEGHFPDARAFLRPGFER